MQKNNFLDDQIDPNAVILIDPDEYNKIFQADWAFAFRRWSTKFLLSNPSIAGCLTGAATAKTKSAIKESFSADKSGVGTF